MKLPAELPNTTCWLPFLDTADTLYQWRERHAPNLELHPDLPRNVRLHASNPVVALQPSLWRLLGEVDPPVLANVDWVVSLDPISLAADQRDVRIAAWPVTALSADEAQHLGRDVAAHLAGDHESCIATATLHVAVADRWYLCGHGGLPDIANALPENVVGQALRDFPTSGADARLWRRISTELQMLLHSHAVNDQRMDNGLSSVNGVWWFGGSVVAAETASLSLVPLVSSDAFWRGCWRAHDAPIDDAWTQSSSPLGGVALAEATANGLTRVRDAIERDEISSAVISVGESAVTLKKPSRWRRLFRRAAR